MVPGTCFPDRDLVDERSVKRYRISGGPADQRLRGHNEGLPTPNLW